MCLISSTDLAEKCYAPHDVAELLAVSPTWVYRTFRNYPGVLWLGERKRGKRSYLTGRISERAVTTAFRSQVPRRKKRISQGRNCIAALSLLLTFHLTIHRGRPPEEVAWLAMQRTTELIEHIGPVHSRTVVIEPQQGWIGHTRFPSETIQRPLLAGEDLTNSAQDHGTSVPEASYVRQISFTYKLFFTCEQYRSMLIPLKCATCLKFHFERRLRSQQLDECQPVESTGGDF